MLPTPSARGIVLANSLPQWSILMNMVFDKISDRGSWEKTQLAQPVRTILVVYMEPKRFFSIFWWEILQCSPYQWGRLL
jgi:hypothetical protein